MVAASLKLFGGIAIVSLLLRVDIARGYLAIALPLGISFFTFTQIAYLADKPCDSHQAARPSICLRNAHHF